MKDYGKRQFPFTQHTTHLHFTKAINEQMRLPMNKNPFIRNKQFRIATFVNIATIINIYLSTRGKEAHVTWAAK